MKKATNRILSFLTAFAMVIGVLVAPFTSANASETEAEKTTKVTLHKILMTKAELEAWDENGPEGYDGTQNLQQLGELQSVNKTLNEIPDVFFAFQNSEGKFLGKDGKVLADNLQDLKAEGFDKKAFEAAVLGGKTTADGLELDTTNLPQTEPTEYTIVEIPELSTYKGKDEDGKSSKLLAGSKAVPVKITLPLYNDEGLVTEAHVYPKNTQEKPEIDKNFGADNDLTTVKDDQNNQKSGAAYENYAKEKATVTANLGKQIPYEVKTKIKKDSKYKKLVWNDNMTKGLTYQKDLKVEGAGLTADDYFVTETDRGFTLVLKDSGLTKVENAAKTADVEIKLTYSAKINGEAVVDKPELNDIALDYSNKPGKDSEPKEFTPGKQEITMKKSWDVTGDQTVTEADKGVTAYFTLQKKNAEGKWEDVETVEKTEKDNFEVKFSNLDEKGTYRIVESVKGYEAEYMEYNAETGEIEIKDHKDGDNPERLNPTEPKVQLGGRKFVKTNNENKDSDKLERLAGAEFYVKNAEGEYLVAAKKPFTPTEEQKDDPVTAAKKALDEAVTAYNNLSAEEQKGDKGTAAKNLINDKQKEYNDAFVANATEYTWGKKDDANVVVLTSDAEGRFEIKGLEYKEGYKLEEKTAPKGFAKLQSDETFAVNDGSYASTDAELQYNKDNADNGYGLQIKNKNVTIPQTGGIGSLIFIVAGLAIMGIAFVAMKKRNAVEA